MVGDDGAMPLVARAARDRRRPAHRALRRPDRGRDAAPASTRPTSSRSWGSAPTTTRRSPACTRRRATWSAPRSRPPGWCGRARCSHAANIAGGLHHAMPDRASGFCVYNDVAVAIRWLLAQGAKRVAYVDVDVHHGDGVEQVFWDDPRVLTISLHETGQMLFPGTGFAHDLGGAGRGGQRGQRRAAARHRRRGLAARVPRRRPAAGAGVRARRAGHPARLRLAHERPAGAPDAQRRRPAGGVPGAARPRARGHRRQVGGHRRRWLRVVEVVPRAWTHLLGVVSGHAGRPRGGDPRRTGAGTSPRCSTRTPRPG